MFTSFLGNVAPVHAALPYHPRHDGLFHQMEARRGRGKSFNAVNWGYLWLVDRLPAILDGRAPHARWARNAGLNHHRLALKLVLDGHVPSLEVALDLVNERIVYPKTWDEWFTLYDSFGDMDENSRNMSAHERRPQEFEGMVHDFHKQTRKHFFTLLYADQFLDNIAVRYRMLVDRLWRVKVVRSKDPKTRGPDGTFRPIRFNLYGSDPHGKGFSADVVRRAEFKMQFKFDLAIARIYDSYQAIPTFEPESMFRSFRQLDAYMRANGLMPDKADEILFRNITQKDEPGVWALVDERLGLRVAVQAGGPGSASSGVLPGRHAQTGKFASQAAD